MGRRMSHEYRNKVAERKHDDPVHSDRDPHGLSADDASALRLEIAIRVLPTIARHWLATAEEGDTLEAMAQGTAEITFMVANAMLDEYDGWRGIDAEIEADRKEFGRPPPIVREPAPSSTEK